MRDDVFLDTNVLIYATQPNDARFAMATVTLNAGGIVSVQVLNEFSMLRAASSSDLGARSGKRCLRYPISSIRRAQSR